MKCESIFRELRPETYCCLKILVPFYRAVAKPCHCTRTCIPREEANTPGLQTSQSFWARKLHQQLLVYEVLAVLMNEQNHCHRGDSWLFLSWGWQTASLLIGLYLLQKIISHSHYCLLDNLSVNKYIDYYRHFCY